MKQLAEPTTELAPWSQLLGKLNSAVSQIGDTPENRLVVEVTLSSIIGEDLPAFISSALRDCVEVRTGMDVGGTVEAEAMTAMLGRWN